MKKLLLFLALAAAGLQGRAEDVSISTAEQLETFAQRVNGGETTLNALITADIDAGDLTPIGTQSNPYRGVFNGQYHVIKLAIDKTSSDRVGLIGCVGGGSTSETATTIKNIIVVGSVKGKAFTAGIVGASQGGGWIKIENCGNEAAITGAAQNAAGIFGCNFNSGARIEIHSCYNAGSIDGNSESAGISGWLGSNYDVYNSYNIGEVVRGVDGSNYFARCGESHFNNCMGLTGRVNDGFAQFTDEQVKNKTMLTKDGDNTRLNKSNDYWDQKGTKPLPKGFFGQTISVATASQLKLISERVNTISIRNQDFQLSADVDMSSVADYWPIGSDDNKYSGELNGNKHTVTLSIDKSGYENQALFGIATDGANIHDLIVDGSVKATKRVAGIVGLAKGGGTVTLTNVINMANVDATGNDGQQNAAGLVGCGDGTAITATNCANMGSVKNSGYTEGTQQCAAFAGWTATGTTFTNCWNSGIISNYENSAILYRNTGQASQTNCYHVTDDANFTPENGTKVGTSTLASGELCYKLNGNTSGGTNWYQTLGTDNYPVPFSSSEPILAGQWFNSSEIDVYYNKDASDKITVYKIDLNEDKTAYNVPANVTTKHFSFSRNYIAGEWIGFCTPISFLCPSDWEARELTAVNGNGEDASMTFSETKTLWAGRPYLVKPSRTENTKFSIGETGIISAAEYENNKTKSINGINMIGNLCQTTLTNGDFYINKSSELRKLSAASATLKGFRAYFTVDDISPVKALSFDFEDDATSIQTIDNGQWTIDNEIYNLAGQRINKMQKGINIVNGKKVMVK